MPRNHWHDLLTDTIHRICEVQVRKYMRAAMRQEKVCFYRHPILWLKQKWRKFS